MRRRGWVQRGIKNPETIAQHTFRVALMNWFIAQESSPELNLQRVIKSSLAHDLCEVYAGDITPYDGLLTGNLKQDRETLKRWVRLSKKDREEKAREKFVREKKAFERLVSNLPRAVSAELMGAWLDYEQLYSQEGRIARQGDKVETLLQALEYLGAKGRDAMDVAWWEDTEQVVDEPILKLFIDKIENFFYKKNKPDRLLEFLLEVGKLKKLPRRGWAARGFKNPETVADHSFTVALMVWVLGAGRKDIDMERALKTALIHEICAVYAGDYTPHDIFSQGLRKWFKAWGEKPRLEQEKRQKLFLATYQKETQALQKLIQNLPTSLRNEILELWSDFVEKRCREADFVDQVNCLATYLQALEYWQKDNKFPVSIFAENAAHFCHEPQLLEFLGELNSRFALPGN